MLKLYTYQVCAREHDSDIKTYTFPIEFHSDLAAWWATYLGEPYCIFMVY